MSVEAEMFGELAIAAREHGETPYHMAVSIRPVETWEELAWLMEHIEEDRRTRAARFDLVTGLFEWHVETSEQYPIRPWLFGTTTLTTKAA